MAHLAQLSNYAVLGTLRLAAANNAGDGSGTVPTALTMAGRTTKIATYTVATSGVISVPNWSKMSNDSVGNIINGMKMNFVAGTGLTTIALNTDYYISNLAVSTLDVATFELLDSAYAPLAASAATNPVLMFAGFGGRLEQVVFTPSQATKAAVPAKVGTAYYKPRGGSFRKMLNSDIAITAHTPSTTVVATSFTIVVAQPFEFGDSFGATISVYTAGQDQTDVVFYGQMF